MKNPVPLRSLSGCVRVVGLVIDEDAPDGLPGDEHGDWQHQQHPKHAENVVSSLAAAPLDSWKTDFTWKLHMSSSPSTLGSWISPCCRDGSCWSETKCSPGHLSAGARSGAGSWRCSLGTGHWNIDCEWLFFYIVSGSIHSTKNPIYDELSRVWCL